MIAFASKVRSDCGVEKEHFSSFGFVLGHHSSTEQLPNGLVVVSKDLLQDVRRVLPKQGGWPGL